MVCTACGNCDATVCLDCCIPDPARIAWVIANELGGEQKDYDWLGEQIATDFGWSEDLRVG